MIQHLLAAGLVLIASVATLGPLPDASQEGLLWPWKGYASVALFHFKVPEESTRATFEFASFQDKIDCPSRQVRVWLQHGGFPVVDATSTDEFPPAQFFMDRSHMEWLTLESAYKPSETLVHPVYAPQAGSWFAAAYLEPSDEPLGFLRQQCRYSLGSIALWNRADNVELIQANLKQTFYTSRHFSYYKFYIPEDIHQFSLTLSDCQVHLKRSIKSNESCVEYIGLRAKALPLHRPKEFRQEWRDLPLNGSATFTEDRPYEASHYYLLVVSQMRVSFSANLSLQHCGESGIYGPVQQKWYLNERGLVRSSSNKDVPKEPTDRFQLFATSLSKQQDDYTTFEYLQNNYSSSSGPASGSELQSCISKFDFTRIDNVRAFSAIYMVQGRSWYTKWLTVLEEVPIFTRFKTFDFTDLGGSLNIRVRIDTDLSRGPNDSNYFHVVTGCLSRGRPPRVTIAQELSCDNPSSTIRVSNLEKQGDFAVEAIKVVPFPQPGLWYIGFQLHCRLKAGNASEIPCPKSSVSTMISVDVNIQPCDHRPLREACGGSGHGMCTTNNKGPWSFSSCSCAPGYRGWTCDQVDQAMPHSMSNTLLLTLSNLFFLPAIALAFYRGAYAQCLVYAATMVFSIFYHACDQEAFNGTLPKALQITCLSLYVNNEVLQFCDFFSAILSFWVTVVSLSSLPAEITNALNLFGALLIAFLVKHNRTGPLVLLIPVPLGIAIVLLSHLGRALKRKRCQLPSRRTLLVLVPAVGFLTTAVIFATLVGTTQNYPYVHSGWHLLISMALAFLVVKCGRGRSKVAIMSNAAAGPSNEDSEAPTVESDSPNTETQEANGFLKRLSYIQKFSLLIARHESST